MSLYNNVKQKATNMIIMIHYHEFERFPFAILSSIYATKNIHKSNSITASNRVNPLLGAMSPKLTVVLTQKL